MASLPATILHCRQSSDCRIDLGCMALLKVGQRSTSCIIKKSLCLSLYRQSSVRVLEAGYGKQEPATASDCWLTIISLLAGTCIWTFLASVVTTLLISLNAASSEYMVKIQEISTYMEHRHLPQVKAWEALPPPPFPPAHASTFPQGEQSAFMF